MKLIDDNIDFAEWTALEDAHKVRPASDYVEQLIEKLAGSEGIQGYQMPWAAMKNRFMIRPGELTLWAGINGHKKSTASSQALIGLMRQGAKVLVASMEMAPYKTMERMVKQAAVHSNPGESYIRDFGKWTDGKMWIYDKLGNVSPEKIIGVCNYAIQVHGVDQILIDSLMKCRIGSDDWTAQKDFVNDLTSLCLDRNIHCHLVVHARKGESEKVRIGKFDVKGASEIVDQADNLLLIQKNLSKTEGDDTEPDLWMTVGKQRHGAWEGQLQLWDRHGTFCLTHKGSILESLRLPEMLDPESTVDL